MNQLQSMGQGLSPAVEGFASLGGGAVPSATDDVIKLQEKIMKQQSKSNSLDAEIKRVQEEILNQRKLMNGKTP
jgi:hypothetical protein